MRERLEVIDVKDAPTETLRVPIGKHGPRVRPGYSLAWVALNPLLLRAPPASNVKARDWAAFRTDPANDWRGFVPPGETRTSSIRPAGCW